MIRVGKPSGIRVVCLLPSGHTEMGFAQKATDSGKINVLLDSHSRVSLPTAMVSQDIRFPGQYVPQAERPPQKPMGSVGEIFEQIFNTKPLPLPAERLRYSILSLALLKQHMNPSSPSIGKPFFWYGRAAKNAEPDFYFCVVKKTPRSNSRTCEVICSHGLFCSINRCSDWKLNISNLYPANTIGNILVALHNRIPAEVEIGTGTHNERTWYEGLFVRLLDGLGSRRDALSPWAWNEFKALFG